MKAQESGQQLTPVPGTMAAPVPVEPPKDVAKEKAVVPAVEQKKPLESQALVEKTPEPTPSKISGAASDRDIALAKVEKEKSLSFIKAWEDTEKTKAENKAQKKIASIIAQENSKKAALEASLRKKEQQLEQKKAEYAEKMKNKMALLHKEAEEKKAVVEAKRREEFLKAEDMAAQYRATGRLPTKKFLGCF